MSERISDERLPMWSQLTMDEYNAIRSGLLAARATIAQLKADAERNQARIPELEQALSPFRCRADWWHSCVLGKGPEILCYRKRIKFMHPDGTRVAAPPLPSEANEAWMIFRECRNERR